MWSDLSVDNAMLELIMKELYLLTTITRCKDPQPPNTNATADNNAKQTTELFLTHYSSPMTMGCGAKMS